VGLTVVDEDRYGRRVAEVRLPNGTLVQEVLAREGLAVFYRKYARNCRSAASVERAEAFAKQ
jgi:micrococcal nuclease